MSVAGTLKLKQHEYVSIFVAADSKNSVFSVNTESSWSCNLFSTAVGFHAEKKTISEFSTAGAWKQVCDT